MSVFGPDDSRTGRLPARRGAPMVEEDLRRGAGDTLGHGTLACPRCDAPVALPGPLAAAAATTCPFCGASRHRWAASSRWPAPTRPTRVVVRVFAGADASAAD